MSAPMLKTEEYFIKDEPYYEPIGDEIEARRREIHPYCITIDKEARDYLPHMYGPAGYTVIDEVRQLPLKVSDIYRRLTT